MYAWKQWEEPMATQLERISIVETKITNLDEKIDDLKVDVKEMHDCLDKTRDELSIKLDIMAKASEEQHKVLTIKFTDFEKSKDRLVYGVAGAVALLGWASGHMDLITKILN